MTIKRTSYWHTSTEIWLGYYENRPTLIYCPWTLSWGLNTRKSQDANFELYAGQRVWDPESMKRLEPPHDHIRVLSCWPNKGLGVFVAQQCCRIYQHIMHLAHRHLRMSRCSPAALKLYCSFIIWCFMHAVSRPGQRSRYNDSLLAGRSGYQMLVRARFSAPVQTGPGVHPAYYTVGIGSVSRG